jgi:hypothetical protein
MGISAPIVSTRVQHRGPVIDPTFDRINDAVQLGLSIGARRAAEAARKAERQEDRDFSKELLGMRFEHEGGMQRAGFEHTEGMQTRGFEHEGSMFDKRAGHELGVLDLTQAFQEEQQGRLFGHQRDMQGNELGFRRTEGAADREVQREGIAARSGGQGAGINPVSLFGQVFPTGSFGSQNPEDAVRLFNRAHGIVSGTFDPRREEMDNAPTHELAPVAALPPAGRSGSPDPLAAGQGPTVEAADSLNEQRAAWDRAAESLRASNRDVSILGPRP